MIGAIWAGIKVYMTSPAGWLRLLVKSSTRRALAIARDAAALEGGSLFWVRRGGSASTWIAPRNWWRPAPMWSARLAHFVKRCSVMRWRRYHQRRRSSWISRKSPRPESGRERTRMNANKDSCYSRSFAAQNGFSQSRYPDQRADCSHHALFYGPFISEAYMRGRRFSHPKKRVSKPVALDRNGLSVLLGAPAGIVIHLHGHHLAFRNRAPYIQLTRPAPGDFQLGARRIVNCEGIRIVRRQQYEWAPDRQLLAAHQVSQRSE